MTFPEYKHLKSDKFLYKIAYSVIALADFNCLNGPKIETKASTEIQYVQKPVNYCFANIPELEHLLKTKYIANFGNGSLKPFIEHFIELYEVSQKNKLTVKKLYF